MIPILLFAATAAAASIPRYSCVNFMLPVGVSDVTTLELDVKIPDGFAAVELADTLTRRGAPMPNFPKTNLTKTFNIAAEYCTPNHATPSTLQILTHGIGFDKSYWDYRPPGDRKSTNYSYINAAIEAGYSTLSWDRLGIAPSTIANPLTEIQTLVELAVLTNLTQMAKTGAIPQVPKPEKIIHVGHSWGSQLTLAIASTAPELTDGIVLTGFSNYYGAQDLFIASSSFHLANTNQPKRFPPSQYSNYFLTWPDVYAFQYSFLAYPYFSDAVARDVEAHKFPFTAGEFLSFPLFPTTAYNFKGPVLYLASEYDLIYCGGNCTGLLGPTSAAVTAFNASSDVSVVIQPNAGHALNINYNATGAYGVITDWAKGHGF